MNADLLLRGLESGSRDEKRTPRNQMAPAAGDCPDLLQIFRQIPDDVRWGFGEEGN
jgi:hypothetical protein